MEKKPRASLEKKTIGYSFGLPQTEWVACNEWGNSIAWGKTRKECEADCRRAGFVPERK